MKKAEIAIIGGSGLYNIGSHLKEIKIETPYGPPSDKILLGIIKGRKVAFLARHGKTHDIPPHKINYRANIYALKKLGVSRIIASHAVGSLQKEIKPGDFVILDQFVDRTKGRIDTFYNGQIVTHISTAFPYCPQLRKLAIKTTRNLGVRTHKTGTVVIIQGPRFSTVAESKWFTKMGWDVVNMTEYPEVVLAREKEMCYCAIAMVTDYDVGLIAEDEIEPVSVRQITKVFKQNIIKVKKIILEMIKNFPKKTNCICQKSLQKARFN